jgi:hypothetical protein
MTDETIRGPLLSQLLVADHEDRTLLGGSSIHEILGELVTAAGQRGCSALLGASHSGSRLVGALLALNPETFHLWSPGKFEPVLAVEGVAVGDAALRNAIRNALIGGAESAFGVMIAPSEQSPSVSSSVVDVIKRAEFAGKR